ncbi:MAG: TonB-dependent receptor, partial [Pricia sp.]|nr:TonB-dependent receptor [Pricia sp.]
MASVLKRDASFENIPSIKAKTLRINLNPDIYGTFAEIGAGQETARHFFRSGGASGTIAKAMSAYDKDFSDAIYGIEKDSRYVTQSRLKKMLSHEMQLMEERISRKTHPDRLFFSYANTVATIDFSNIYNGHGWIGIRFQLDPRQKELDEIILHIRFKQNEARLQQETLGI